MNRNLIYLALLFFVLLALLFFFNLKKSWEILPVDPPVEKVGAAPTQNWLLFQDPRNEFKILFPNKPKAASNELKDAKTQSIRKQDMYVAEKPNGTVYMISRLTFPNTELLADKEAVLKAAVSDLISGNPDNKLKKSKLEDFQGGKALRFEIQNEEVNTQGLALIRGKSLFVLTAISKDKDRNDAENNTFLSSFQPAESP